MISPFQTLRTLNAPWFLLWCIFSTQTALSAKSFQETESVKKTEMEKIYVLPEDVQSSEVRELIFLTESLSGEETGKKEFLLRVNGTPEFHAGFTSALKIARDGNPRETQTERVVREALRQTVSWKFEELHLETFAEALQKLLPVPVVLDPDSLPAENWKENAGPVDFSGLTLCSVLDHLFVSHHLEWFIQDEKFFLTDADGCSEEEIEERLALGINDSIFLAKPLRMLAIYREPLTLFPAKEFLQELSQTKEVPPKFRFSDPPEDVLEPNAKDGSDISEMDLFENGAFLDAFPSMF